MRTAPSIRPVVAALRRLGDVLGLSAGAAGGVVLAVLMVLGVLVGFGQPLAAGLVALVVAAAAAVVVVRFLQPVRVLTRDVDRAASELPAVLAAAPAPVPDLAAAGPAELGSLAGAVTSMRAAAVSFAAQEHERHRRTGDLTAHLARRNHSLVDRLVTQIGELESAERSPVVLAQLSRLKHTATRTRRHAENVLVLTGSLPDRSRPRPGALVEVLRTALAGVEDHGRVRIDDVEPAAVSGSALADLAHLVAELVENAAHFSPPGTPIRIIGAPHRDTPGYRIRIVDHGIGMTTDQLDAANARIRHGESDARAVKLVGLNVAGQLAARHGIDVRLAHGDGDGVIATVTLPARLLVPLSDLPAPRRPVSALVAAAAFRPPVSTGGEAPLPPLPSLSSPSKPDPESASEPSAAAVAEPEMVRPGVPRRVRGAQLPDLGPDRTDGPQITPDAGRAHGRLNALQSGLSAARTGNIPPLPRALPEQGEPVPVVPGHAPDGDD